MTVHATPSILIAGGGVTLGATSTLFGIEDLRVTWGRSSVLGAATPATVQVVVLDTAAGYPFARRNDLIGQPVVLSWTADDAAHTSRVFFRGRVTDVEVTPHDDGMRVVLACSSKEVDLGNYIAPYGTSWPAESAIARLDHITALAPGLFSTAPALSTSAGYSASASYTIGAAAPAGTDALTLIRQLFQSLCLPYGYDPNADTITAVGRMRAPDVNALGVSYPGRLAPSPRAPAKYAALSDAGFGFRSEHLIHDPALTAPMDSKVTRVEVKWKNGTADAVAAQTVAGALAESVIGRRTLAIDTTLTVSAQAIAIAQEWASLAGEEGSRRQLAPVTYSSKLNGGGFDDVAHLTFLTRGGPSSQYAFLAGSWATRLGVRPIVGVLAAVIRYTRGQWLVEFTPAPITWAGLTLGAAPTPPTAAASSAVRLADIDPSVTFGDLAFINLGAGIAPPSS